MPTVYERYSLYGAVYVGIRVWRFPQIVNVNNHVVTGQEQSRMLELRIQSVLAFRRLCAMEILYLQLPSRAMFVQSLAELLT